MSFICEISSFKLVWLAIRLVSPENSKQLKKVETLGKSLIKIINKRGPKIEPWGTSNIYLFILLELVVFMGILQAISKIASKTAQVLL